MERKVGVTAIGDKSLTRRIETIKRQRIVNKKVVNLSDFRELRKAIDTKTILVVDDDEIMRSALKRILENDNYSVLMAQDGLELAKILETARLDLILLDVSLPWVNGFELCRLIKDHHSLKHVPLIFVSALKSEEDIAKGLEAGASDYITKPFDVGYIMGVINKTLLQSS